jgi:phage terminase large subunit-like protein
MEWTTACPDWSERVVARKSLVPFAPLFPSEATAALDVFKSLRIVDAAGQPTFGEAAEEWVFDFVEAIFGAYDPDSARRLITEFFLLISKKNGKSTIAAAIMLTALIRNWRHSAELLILAPTLEVANNSYKPARDMVKADPELDRLLHVQENFRQITHRITRAVLKVVAADTDTVGGKKAAFILIDELWIFGKRANAENMLREAAGGLASRPEGFTIYLTTQSDEPPAGVMRQKLSYARGVRDGRIDDKRFLPVLYEFPDAMVKAEAYRQKVNFYITNPNLGVSVDQEFLEREFEKAVEAGEDSLCGFMAKHLNVEMGLALRSGRWNGADYWQQAADPSITLATLLDRCEVALVGIDGGGLDDLLGLAVLGRERGTRRWLLWSKAWAHTSVLERRKSEASRLKDFENAGDLVIVDDMEVAFGEAADIAAQVDAAGVLAEVDLDPMGVGAIIDALAERGIDGDDRIIGVPQGWQLNGAIKTTEVKLANGTLWHAGQPLMAWAVGNAKAEPKGNAVTITKQTAGTAKIDPLIAAFCAVARMSRNPVAVPRLDPAAMVA